jgi:hypothetical protein
MSYAMAILIYGYNLGGPGDQLGWNIPTRPNGHPDVTWYDPDSKDLYFGQQAAAHLLTVKGGASDDDWMPDDMADDLAKKVWGVHIVSYGADHQPRWLMATHETSVCDIDSAESVNMPELVRKHDEWNARLRAALAALGIPEPAEPTWHLAAYDG